LLVFYFLSPTTTRGCSSKRTQRPHTHARTENKRHERFDSHKWHKQKKQTNRSDKGKDRKKETSLSRDGRRAQDRRCSKTLTHTCTHKRIHHGKASKKNHHPARRQRSSYRSTFFLFFSHVALFFFSFFVSFSYSSSLVPKVYFCCFCCVFCPSPSLFVVWSRVAVVAHAARAGKSRLSVRSDS